MTKACIHKDATITSFMDGRAVSGIAGDTKRMSLTRWLAVGHMLTGIAGCPGVFREVIDSSQAPGCIRLAVCGHIPVASVWVVFGIAGWYCPWYHPAVPTKCL